MIKEEEKLIIQEMNQYLLNEELEHSCSNGHIHIVKYLLTSPELTEHADIHTKYDLPFRFACSNGHLEIVKYLLTSSDLTEHANIHANQGNAFNQGNALAWACYNNHLEVVKYLLTSPELTEHANIHADNDKALRTSCNKGHLELVKYLLTSPDLKEHANMNIEDKAFIYVCENENLDIIKYLIFDYQIEKQTYIEQYLIKGKKNDILMIFNKRDLEKKLQVDLQQPDKSYNKLKL